MMLTRPLLVDFALLFLMAFGSAQASPRVACVSAASGLDAGAARLAEVLGELPDSQLAPLRLTFAAWLVEVRGEVGIQDRGLALLLRPPVVRPLYRNVPRELAALFSRSADLAAELSNSGLGMSDLVFDLQEIDWNDVMLSRAEALHALTFKCLYLADQFRATSPSLR